MQQQEKQRKLQHSTAHAIVAIENADAWIVQAQEVYAPLDGSAANVDTLSSARTLLMVTARKLQSARRLLEASRGIFEMLPNIDLELLEPPVTATCYSDDHAVEVECFDATLWFARGTDEDIQKLQAESYRGCSMADNVAVFIASYDARVQAMFDHNEALPETVEVRGFECHVQQAEARKWIHQHRPHLLNDWQE